jgi:hypothetical protein
MVIKKKEELILVFLGYRTLLLLQKKIKLKILELNSFLSNIKKKHKVKFYCFVRSN